MYRYNVAWSIPNAGPAVSVFHFANTDDTSPLAVVTALRAAFNAISAYIPNEVMVQFPAEYTVLDNLTGQAIDFRSIVPPAPVVGSSSGTWAAGSGARLVWATDSVGNGRRVRGTTYLVPLVATTFDTNGVVAPAAQTAIAGAFSTFLAAASSGSITMGVFHRPTLSPPGGGYMARAVSVSVPGTPATLRGRKY